MREDCAARRFSKGVFYVSLRILFADDSMTAQNMGKKILAEAGYDVVAVSNGAAAVKRREVAVSALIVSFARPRRRLLAVAQHRFLGQVAETGAAVFGAESAVGTRRLRPLRPGEVGVGEN